MALTLAVISTRSTDEVAKASGKHGVAHTLVLDEGLLVGPDGGAETLWSASDKDEMRNTAQEVSERAWTQFKPGIVSDADQLAAIVVAASKLDVYWDFCSYYRNSKLLERAAQKLNPTRIEWRSEEALPRVATSAAVRSSKLPAWATKTEGGATGWLKRTKWEWTARAIAGSLEKSHAVGTPVAGIDVLGVFDVRNAGMIQSVGRVVGYLNQSGRNVVGVSMHSHVTQQARASSGMNDVRPLARFSRLGDVGQALGDLPAVSRVVRRLGTLAHSDPTVHAAIQHAFRGLHSGYVLQTLLDLRAVERMLDALTPRSIVLASDAHRYSRLVVAAAARRQVPTFVLQHGAPAQAHFFTPVVADYMLAWGPWCRDWFVERGTPERRVHAVGFVRASERKEFRSADHGLRPKATRLLFAAQPIANHITEELLGVVRQALELDPALTVKVRPHPGEGRRDAIQEMLGRWPQETAVRCNVSSQGWPLEQDLNETDIVVMAQSTVGIDALAAGVPVFLLVHSGISEPIPFREFGCVVEVEAAGDIVAGLKSIQDASFVADLAAAAARFLEAYVGRVGSDAVAEASRIIGEIASTQAGSI